MLSNLNFPLSLNIPVAPAKVLTIGQTIKEMILEQVREAGIYGLLADDATDIAVMEQMSDRENGTVLEQDEMESFPLFKSSYSSRKGNIRLQN